MADSPIIKFLYCLLGLCFYGVIALIIWGIVWIFSDPQKDAFEKARSESNPWEYFRYIEKYPNGKFYDEAIDSIFSFTRSLNINVYRAARDTPLKINVLDSLYSNLCAANIPIKWKEFISKVDSADLRNSAAEYQASIQTSYDNALSQANLNGWLNYIDKVPQEHLRDAEEMIHNCLLEEYGSDIGLLVISYPSYPEKNYHLEVSSRSFSREKYYTAYPHTHATDSIYLPYGHYSISISTDGISRYSSSVHINSKRDWLPLVISTYTITRRLRY